MTAPDPHHPDPTGAPLPFDAIIVAGGRGSRLGGIDKPALRHRGSSLLDLAVAAAAGAARICVVGPRRSLSGDDHVAWAIEEPRGGGPSAAMGAGIRELSDDCSELTLVLAADLVNPGDAVGLLRAEPVPETAHGVIALDESGRRQPLMAIYRTVDLARAAETELDGLPLRRLLAGLRLREIVVPDAFCADVDTPEDAQRHGIPLPGDGRSPSEWLP